MCYSGVWWVALGQVAWHCHSAGLGLCLAMAGGRAQGMCVRVWSKGVCGVMRKARGCSVLRRSRMGSATLCRDGCFGVSLKPASLSREPVPGKSGMLS